jgi:hypothetical protein
MGGPVTNLAGLSHLELVTRGKHLYNRGLNELDVALEVSGANIFDLVVDKYSEVSVWTSSEIAGL